MAAYAATSHERYGNNLEPLATAIVPVNVAVLPRTKPPFFALVFLSTPRLLSPGNLPASLILVSSSFIVRRIFEGDIESMFSYADSGTRNADFLVFILYVMQILSEAIAYALRRIKSVSNRGMDAISNK